MSLHLSVPDLERLERAHTTLLSPLLHRDRAAWVADLGPRLMELFHGDHLVLILPCSDGLDWYTSNLRPETERGIRRFVETPIEELRRWDPVITRMEERRRVLGWEAFRMDMLDHVLEDRLPYRRTSYFQEIIAAAKIRDSRNLNVQVSAGAAYLCVSRERGPDDDPLGAAGLPMLRLLLPAFRAGVEMLLRWEGERDRMAALLDRFPAALMLVSAAGKELHRNLALARILDADPSVDKIVAQLRRAARAVNHEEPDGFAFADQQISTSVGRFQIRTSIAPQEAFGEGVVLVALERTAVTLPSVETLQRYSGLTRREAEIALLLANGSSNRELAARLHLSVHTVRHHTESIFLKLDIHTRREIRARLLAIGSDTTG